MDYVLDEISVFACAVSLRMIRVRNRGIDIMISAYSTASRGLLSAGLLVSVCGSAVALPSLVVLEPPSGAPAASTNARGLSADGERVVGFATSGTTLGPPADCCPSAVSQFSSLDRLILGPGAGASDLAVGWTTPFAPGGPVASFLQDPSAARCAVALNVNEGGTHVVGLTSLVNNTPGCTLGAICDDMATFWASGGPAFDVECIGFQGCEFYPWFAVDVSLDGSVIIGWGSLSCGDTYGFRWTAGTGLELLPFLDPIDRPSQYPYAMDASGGRIVGSYVLPGPGPEERRVVVWDGLTPTVIMPEVEGEAFDVSRDSSTVVGWFRAPGETFTRAFRWTDGGGRQDLGGPPGVEVRDVWATTTRRSSTAHIGPLRRPHPALSCGMRRTGCAILRICTWRMAARCRRIWRSCCRRRRPRMA